MFLSKNQQAFYSVRDISCKMAKDIVMSYYHAIMYHIDTLNEGICGTNHKALALGRSAARMFLRDPNMPEQARVLYRVEIARLEELCAQAKITAKKLYSAANSTIRPPM